ncbi:DUF3786 domain-containing protein [Candidatus Bathyarchaeota archaeon]|nr:DUF3786 domain-containing protein [Candidatus Bathyarchaeota archaeon]
MRNWDVYATQIRSLRGRLGFNYSIKFLGYVVELSSGKVYDILKRVYVRSPETLYILLAHYSRVEPIERARKLIRFADLSGGHAYEAAFMKRAVFPLTKMFGDKPKILVEAGKILDGVKLTYGDASVEIAALPKIPLTYILWQGDQEIQSSANILFDASVNNYLPTEDLAVLAELTTSRLQHTAKRQ